MKKYFNDGHQKAFQAVRCCSTGRELQTCGVPGEKAAPWPPVHFPQCLCNGKSTNNIGSQCWLPDLQVSTHLPELQNQDLPDLFSFSQHSSWPASSRGLVFNTVSCEMGNQNSNALRGGQPTTYSCVSWAMPWMLGYKIKGEQPSPPGHKQGQTLLSCAYIFGGVRGIFISLRQKWITMAC